MTMEELALEAGVSLSAVSKAFSGSHEVNETTRQRIFDFAKKNGCYYKYIKKSARNPVIAIICNEIRDNYTSRLISSLETEVRKKGGFTIVATDDFNTGLRNDLISYFAEHVGADGIILCSSLGEICKYKIPVIVIGETDKFNSVNMTWDRAIEEAIRHFAEYGHTKIAFIGEKHTGHKNNMFKNAMERCGLTANKDYIIFSNKRFEDAGYDGITRLLALADRPTAILAAHDNIAFGAMKCIKDNGLSVPDDISLIGMNDNMESRYLNVPLTTGTAYLEDISEITADLIFEKIKTGDYKTIKTIKVSSELVKRGSVGYAK